MYIKYISGYKLILSEYELKVLLNYDKFIYMQEQILIIEDSASVQSILCKIIEKLGHNFSTASTLSEATSLIKSNNYDLILLDLYLPDGYGLDILPDLLKLSNKPEVIIITGTGDINGAKLAFEHGIWDFLQKPLSAEEISLSISRALKYSQGKQLAKMPVSLSREGIIGESDAIKHSLKDVARASASDASVLITGETGTGKELFARAVHANSKRANKKFVALDCCTLNENLAMSTLFGHEKGSYTGADKKQEGVISQANGGTLFLDEIGDLPISIQKSLLRALQEKSILPVGAKQEKAVNFRIVSATNACLNDMVKKKQFREDLLFRISAIEIKLPPLRDRKKDIKQIAINKIQQLCDYYNINSKGLSFEFIETLNENKWKGNVRELINVLEYALASANNDPVLLPKHLPSEYRMFKLNFKESKSDNIQKMKSTFCTFSDEIPDFTTFQELNEKKYLQYLLEKSKGNRKKACQLSGMSQARLYRLLKKYNLPRFSTSQ